MKKLLLLKSFILLAILFNGCSQNSQKKEKVKEQSMICKCKEECQKGSQWYKDNEYECIKLSNEGQRCSE